MIRVLAKYLISLFILLLYGHSNHAIPSHQNSAQYSSINDYSTNEFANLNEAFNSATLSKKPYSPGTKRLHHDLIAPIFDYFIPLFSINSSRYQINFTNQVSYPNNNLSEHTHRHIAFGVFRI
jgi:hypothetical protein